MIRPKRSLRFLGPASAALLATIWAAVASSADAQEVAWPTRFVRMIVPGGSATAADVAGRLVAQHLSDKWGQQLVVENRPGAGGMAGTAQIARSNPDGYSLLFAQGAPLSLSPFTSKSVPYDVERDLEPIVFVGKVPLVLAVSKKLGVSTVGDLVALAKGSPGKLSFATASARSIPQLAADLFMRLSDIKMIQVVYNGYPHAIQDTMTGTVDAIFGGAQIISQAEGGSLQILGVSTSDRLPNHPSIPTVADTVANFDISGWIAVMGPKGVSETLVTRLNGDFRRILEMAEVKERLIGLGVYPDTANIGTSAALAQFIRNDTAFMREAVRASGISAN